MFFLLEHQSRYKEKPIEEVTYLMEYEKKCRLKPQKKVELQNKIDLLNDIEEIIEQAKEETKKMKLKKA